jgi:hypothetical protein
MATTFTKIADVTVGSGGAATIDFTSIPSTYTDLVLKVSAKNLSGQAQTIRAAFNGSTSNTSTRYLEGTGSTVYSGTDTNWMGSSGDSTNVFSSFEWYIPNYAGSNYKSISIDSVTELNGNPAYATLIAGLWSQTAAINQITLTQSGSNFAQYSTATLYGVNNA